MNVTIAKSIADGDPDTTGDSTITTPVSYLLILVVNPPMS